MKIRLSKITLGFTIAGLLFALIQVGLSLLYGMSSNPDTKENISKASEYIYLTCPFVLGEIGMDNDKVFSDWLIFYAMMTGLNVALYFVVGLIASFTWRTLKRGLEPSVGTQR